MSPPSSTAGESRAAVVIGIGATVPDYVETNGDLVERMDTCDVWIRQRTGIGQRHLVKSGEATSDLAVKAGQLALESAGVAQVDAVIVATSTPDRICPSTAPTWPRDWGAERDRRVRCQRRLHRLPLRSGRRRRADRRWNRHSVLMIGADTFSTIVDPNDRSTAVIFGDGAGAFVLRAGEPEEPGAIGGFNLGSDGEQSNLAAVAAGGSRQKAPTVRVTTSSSWRARPCTATRCVT